MQSYKLSENRLKKSGEFVGTSEGCFFALSNSRKGMMSMKLLRGGAAYCNLSF